jgi:hypothetical protein
VDLFFERALAKDPDERFQSAQELIDAMEGLLDAGRSSVELSIPEGVDTISDLAAADTEVGELMDSGDENTLEQPRPDRSSMRFAIPSAPQAEESEPEAALQPAAGDPAQPDLDDSDLGVPWDEPPTSLSRARRWAVSLLFGAALAVVAIVLMRRADHPDLAQGGVAPLVLTAVTPEAAANGPATGDGAKNTDGAQDPASSTSIGTGGAPGSTHGNGPQTRPPRGSGGSNTAHAGGGDGTPDEPGGGAPSSSARGDAGRGLELFGDRH